ncbi:hypothetical protein NC653_018121 [Populus alba x Populus x berolinensis]|uniref:Uncharacterized protein n=1 Tax=Populus alba x Populus x berolinensis TaxID=444605 RepID=A0AAD6W1D0_9ROSI|nr:hypothetical protein NC653_018121 [Populus alba x Populus x berolinensis]
MAPAHVFRERKRKKLAIEFEGYPVEFRVYLSYPSCCQNLEYLHGLEGKESKILREILGIQNERDFGSRQPVKRYKKLIADIFPRNQEEGPNDRKIGKLSEYAAKNPLRIPKITSSLEQRCYKELRIENFQSAKIVMCIYRKLLITCKEQMPLFASSLLSIISTLLDQTRQDDIQVIGCETLFDFVNNQKDGTFMFNLEGFIPKLCQFTQEEGKDERDKSPRAAGLQALSSMIWFMGQHSHISVEFDNIVSVVLKNYGGPKRISENLDTDKPGPQNRWVQEVLKNEGLATPLPEVITRVPSWRTIVNERGEGRRLQQCRRVLEILCFPILSIMEIYGLTEKWSLAFPVLKEYGSFLLIDNSASRSTKIVLKEPSSAARILLRLPLALAEHAKVDPSSGNNQFAVSWRSRCPITWTFIGCDVGETSRMLLLKMPELKLRFNSNRLSHSRKLYFHQRYYPAMVQSLTIETRSWSSTRIFSVVLVPSSVSRSSHPQQILGQIKALIFHGRSNKNCLCLLLPAAALFDKTKKDKTSNQGKCLSQTTKIMSLKVNKSNNGILARLTSSTSLSAHRCMKNPYVPSTTDENPKLLDEFLPDYVVSFGSPVVLWIRPNNIDQVDSTKDNSLVEVLGDDTPSWTTCPVTVT